MITISLAMIVRNEEKNLAHCLDSVMAAIDELIIIDTGSTDATKEIAAHYTDKIYDFTWMDDFSKARNYSFSKATCDYIMWLDADDVIAPKDLAKLQALKESLDTQIDAVLMPYNVGFDEDGVVVFSYLRERLLKRERGYTWSEPVHEAIQLYGKLLKSDICITHTKATPTDSKRNLNIYRRMIEQGEKLSLRGTLYYARELKANGEPELAAEQFESFLSADGGWSEDCIRACCECAQCETALGKLDKVPLTLMRSFTYDTPRAEACCLLGEHYKQASRLKDAIFWYELALSLKCPQGCVFVLPYYYDYIPCKELSLCYELSGDKKRSKAYEILANIYKDKHKA